MEDKIIRDQEQRLTVVEARIGFFGSPELRGHYTNLLRELNEERCTLRASIEQARIREGEGRT